MIPKILLLSIFISNLCAGPGDAGAIFMLIAPGAGPQGSGEAQVAKADDAFASWYNPAGLGFIKGREAVGMHVNWLPNLTMGMDDIYYEFLAYRHEYPGLGTIGGHVIFMNLGDQIATDIDNNILGEFSSWMGAIQTSFGTTLSPNSSIGLGFKLIHQNLSPFGAGIETSDGASTDFAFDIGYLKKFKPNDIKYKRKKEKKINHIFHQFVALYDQQMDIKEKIYNLQENGSNIYGIVEDLEALINAMEIQKERLLAHDNLSTYVELDDKIATITNNIEELIVILNVQATFSASNNNSEEHSDIDEPIENNVDAAAVENFISIAEKIVFEFMDIELLREDLLIDVEKMHVPEYDDKFNFGLAITNIGPPIWFKEKEQADPAPTNMRTGIFLELYNDGNNRINFLLDMNKMLVSRYSAMDWDGDGIISGDKELSHDDPWYLAVFTAWLDDWYFGGDLDLNGDHVIGGYYWEDCNGSEGCLYDDGDGIPEYDFEVLEVDDEGNPTVIGPTHELTEGTVYHDDPNTDIESVKVWGEMIETPDEYDFNSPLFGTYNDGDLNNKVEREKGTGKDRTFKTELEEIIYNVGLEYWYTNNFALRTGYIYDFEGKIFQPTFGAGIRLLQYGFDFGYTAGKQSDTRANTMFFSINMKL